MGVVQRRHPALARAGVRFLASAGLTLPEGWEAVPRDLGRRKDRAETFARAWRCWIGPSELIFTHRTEAGHAALAQAGAQSVDYETSARTVWI